MLVFFPFTYIIDDVITEVYGFKISKKIIWVALLVNLIKNDLTNLLEVDVVVNIVDVNKPETSIGTMYGENIDHIEVTCTEYDTANPKLIKYTDNTVTEEINSNLLKSNCLITNQPDWGSISIKYTGKQLNRESLIQYIASLRNHMNFMSNVLKEYFMIFKKSSIQNIYLYMQDIQEGEGLIYVLIAQQTRTF